eukprot:TRINITY_DN9515_c0_g2_i1.p2 TRINITY_DN9515_c0_g2~~TRINITY_DN9515_c0_g2_i1.p2  ORF type:complete len:214 (-),score=46.48 TRINITY_DN9515_c0_g2_i1:304-945(-)
MPEEGIAIQTPEKSFPMETSSSLATTCAIPEEGYPPQFQSLPPAAPNPKITTCAIPEEGSSVVDTLEFKRPPANAEPGRDQDLLPLTCRMPEDGGPIQTPETPAPAPRPIPIATSSSPATTSAIPEEGYPPQFPSLPPTAPRPQTKSSTILETGQDKMPQDNQPRSSAVPEETQTPDLIDALTPPSAAAETEEVQQQQQDTSAKSPSTGCSIC